MTVTLPHRWRKVAALALIFGVMAIMPKEGCNRVADDITSSITVLQ